MEPAHKKTSGHNTYTHTVSLDKWHIEAQAAIIFNVYAWESENKNQAHRNKKKTKK